MNITLPKTTEPGSITVFSLIFTVLFFTVLILKCLMFLYCHCLRPSTNLYQRYRSTSSSKIYAVVTGATKGIGLTFAKQLAARGFSILLVGRSRDKLIQVQTTIHALYSTIDVQFVEIDFAKANKDSMLQLYHMLSTIDVGLLVNNVGMVLPNGLKYFTERRPENMASMCEVNMRACLLMTRLVLPKIVNRKSGGIINMSSISGLHPTPLLTTYAATKSFVHSLSLSLSEETSGLSNIDILSCTPGFVATDMSYSMFGSHAAQSITTTTTDTKSSWCSCIRIPPVITAKMCVESILNQLGNGYVHTSGHWTHGVQNCMHSITPNFILSDITHTCMRTFQNTKNKERKNGIETKIDDEEESTLEQVGLLERNVGTN